MKTKKEMLQWVNRLQVTEEEYDTLINILETKDDRLIIRILEDISNGEFEIIDFAPVFANFQYTETLEEKLKVNKKAQEQLKAYLFFHDYLLVEGNDNVLIENIKQLIIPNQNKDFNEIKEEEIEEDWYSFIHGILGDSYLEKEVKKKLVEYYKKGVVDKNIFQKYYNDNYIPVDFNLITLTEGDKNFANKHGLSYDEVKKLKSLHYYLKAGV